jgi:hypothetical protein
MLHSLNGMANLVVRRNVKALNGSSCGTLPCSRYVAFDSFSRFADVAVGLRRQSYKSYSPSTVELRHRKNGPQ